MKHVLSVTLKKSSKILYKLHVAGPSLTGDEEGDDVQGVKDGGVSCHIKVVHSGIQMTVDCMLICDSLVSIK